MAVMRKCRALIGFDGYIDELQRIIRERKSETEYTCFATISEFASHLSDAAGMSADMETVTISRKLGGNGPILANALSRLGADVTCIGAMGDSEIAPVFEDMENRCRLYSLCDPAYTHAYEFDDGKLMFANVRSLEYLTWENIVGRIGIEELRSMFSESDLIALVNWSGVPKTETVWMGILHDVLPYIPQKNRKFFFDIADPSKKPQSEIISILECISRFSEYGEVTFGVNENEARQLSNAVCSEKIDSLEKIGMRIFDRMQIKTLLIHPIESCLAVTSDGVHRENGALVSHPMISTGGGDNFNAGFCYGWMQDMPLNESMRLAMRVSGWYVGHGDSPEWDDVAEDKNDQSILGGKYERKNG